MGGDSVPPVRRPLMHSWQGLCSGEPHSLRPHHARAGAFAEHRLRDPPRQPRLHVVRHAGRAQPLRRLRHRHLQARPGRSEVAAPQPCAGDGRGSAGKHLDRHRGRRRGDVGLAQRRVRHLSKRAPDLGLAAIRPHLIGGAGRQWRSMDRHARRGAGPTRPGHGSSRHLPARSVESGESSQRPDLRPPR